MKEVWYVRKHDRDLGDMRSGRAVAGVPGSTRPPFALIRRYDSRIFVIHRSTVRHRVANASNSATWSGEAWPPTTASRRSTCDIMWLPCKCSPARVH